MLEKILNKYIKGDFKKNTLILTGGTVLAQLINVLSYVLLGRLFSPADFGVFALFNTILGILAIVGTLKYEGAILIAKTQKDAINILALCVFLSFSILTIVLVSTLFFSDFFAEQLRMKGIAKWLFLCPITAFFFVIFNLYNEWCVRNKYFGYLSVNKMSNSGFISLSKLAIGFFNLFIGGGLILGDVFGRLFSAVGCLYRGHRLDRELLSMVSWSAIQENAKRYREFPSFFLPDQLINKFGQAMPIILLGIYYSDDYLGYFSMTLTVLTLPINVITMALKDVFRQKANQDYQEKGTCRPIFLKLLSMLVLGTILASLLVFFFLPKLFILFLGEQWEMSGVYSQILLPMIAFGFVSMSLSGVLIISNRLKESLYWQIFFLIMTTGSIYLGHLLYGDILHTLMFFSIGRSIAYLLYIAMSYKYAKNNNINNVSRI